ncbi:unnamed protein product [Ectocarpus sp. 6 AP-2014]
MPQVAESPFSESLQEELRVAITILAARLQREKPMSRQEFERFESAVGVIVEDALPLQKLPSPASPASPEAAAAAPPRLAVTQSPVPNADSDGDDDDDFETEGPEWDAEKVQYGLPMGARNTYDIDDMEKMNPEEYQAALRQGRRWWRERSPYEKRDHTGFPVVRTERKRKKIRTTAHAPSGFLCANVVLVPARSPKGLLRSGWGTLAMKDNRCGCRGSVEPRFNGRSKSVSISTFSLLLPWFRYGERGEGSWGLGLRARRTCSP